MTRKEFTARLQERSPYFILAVVCSAMFLDLANLSAITIALPTIQTELGPDVQALQWVISAYALTVISLYLSRQPVLIIVSSLGDFCCLAVEVVTCSGTTQAVFLQSAIRS